MEDVTNSTWNSASLFWQFTCRLRSLCSNFVASTNKAHSLARKSLFFMLCFFYLFVPSIMWATEKWSTLWEASFSNICQHQKATRVKLPKLSIPATDNFETKASGSCYLHGDQQLLASVTDTGDRLMTMATYRGSKTVFTARETLLSNRLSGTSVH